MTTAPDPGLDLTAEQGRSGASAASSPRARSGRSRPRGRRGRRRDAVGALAQGGRARADLVHAPRGARRRRDDRLVTGCVVQEELCHGCSGIGNLITSGGFFAEPVLALGHRRAEGALGRAARGRAPADDRAGDDRAGRRLRRRVDQDDRAPRRRRLRPRRAEDVDLQRRRRRALRRLRHRRARQPLPRRHRVPRAQRRRRASAFGAPMRKMGQRAILNTELFLHGLLRRRRPAAGGGGRGLPRADGGRSTARA